jgi:uncharacterized repeat protein (TIGR03803 family)
VQGANGNFYGTTDFGGTNGPISPSTGTVFEITPEGALTTIHTFCRSYPNPCTNGAYPGGLIRGADGRFYGVTQSGGKLCGSNFGCGTVFKINARGKLTKLHHFDGSDGYAPVQALVQGTNGNFYGTTTFGGALSQGQCATFLFPSPAIGGCGTIFRLHADLEPFVETLPTSSQRRSRGGDPGQQSDGRH